MCIRDRAKESSEFFQNKKIEDEEIENAIDEVRSETLNAISVSYTHLCTVSVKKHCFLLSQL